MSQVTVRIPTPLRRFTAGASELSAQGDTVRGVLQALAAAHAGLGERVLSPEGELWRFVNIYLGPQNINSLRGLATPVADGDVLSIIPALAGGLQ
jgi:molybdopterin converting factor small subunit